MTPRKAIALESTFEFFFFFLKRGVRSIFWPIEESREAKSCGTKDEKISKVKYKVAQDRIMYSDLHF